MFNLADIMELIEARGAVIVIVPRKWPWPPAITIRYPGGEVYESVHRL